MIIECTRYKPIQHGTFTGFADFFFPSMGIEVHDCTIHKKDNQRWVNLPVRMYKDLDGKDKFSPFIRFRDPKDFREFCVKAKEALDKYLIGEKNEHNI